MPNKIPEDAIRNISNAQETFDNAKNWKSITNRKILLDMEESDLEETLDIDLSPKVAESLNKSNKNYHILQKIGEGGMANVYEGWQKNLQRRVAVKSNKKTSIQQKRKFIVEANVTAFLDHPNIVPIYDLYRSNENIFISMKLIQGKTWKELLNERKDQTKEQKESNEKKHIQILIAVCNAIDFAHDKKIIHNDIKPENIIIGKFGEVFVMDWGLAVNIALDYNHICLHKNDIVGAMGTPNYMAPELLAGKGEEIGPWTDIYLLGGILYQILSDVPPHHAKSLQDALLKCITGKIEPLSADIAPSVANICKKSLALRPEDRYQNVKEFQRDLSRFLDHKQSIIISNKAYNEFDQLLKINSFSQTHIYEKFQEIISAFQQALVIWPDNEAAQQGQVKSRLEYAKLALQNKEFALAQAQIEKISHQNQDVETLQYKIAKAQKKHNNIQKIMRRLYWGIGVLIAMVILILTGTIFTMQQQHKRTALKTAKFFVKSLNMVRSKYSNEIVSKVTQMQPKMEVSHDPVQLNQIPFPATFTIAFANDMEALREGKDDLHVRLYSEHPFPWRKKERAKNQFDSFQKDIFQSLKKNAQKTSFVTTVKIDGRSYLRYAEAVLLKKSCVNCHNNHPQSPKMDWKEGDVRGIQEVSVPVETISESIQKLWNFKR